jgi:exodeoxyribonuclease VII large subunit
MDDVLVNARKRFPEVRFEVRQVAVQGVKAVGEVSRAIEQLDADPEVDVIVVTRGGGSVEDLLPFSNEALVRVVAGATTPVVSAIGHEGDAPLLDLVADYRASTPTDAAKRVVPDVVAERHGLDVTRRRLEHAMGARLRAEQDRLTALRTRPVMADPSVMVTAREESLVRELRAMRQTLEVRLERAALGIASLATQVRALSPASTLQRGYAVLRTTDGHVVTDPGEVDAGQRLEAVVAQGRLAVAVEKDHAAASARTTVSD